MKATGIVRRIDDLGRIVVPKEIRRTLRIREGGSPRDFYKPGGRNYAQKYSPVGELGEFAQKLCTGTGTDHRGSGLHYGSGICDRSSGNREKKEVEGGTAERRNGRND